MVLSRHFLGAPVHTQRSWGTEVDSEDRVTELSELKRMKKARLIHYLEQWLMRIS